MIDSSKEKLRKIYNRIKCFIPIIIGLALFSFLSFSKEKSFGVGNYILMMSILLSIACFRHNLTFVYQGSSIKNKKKLERIIVSVLHKIAFLVPLSVLTLLTGFALEYNKWEITNRNNWLFIGASIFMAILLLKLAYKTFRYGYNKSYHQKVDEYFDQQKLLPEKEQDGSFVYYSGIYYVKASLILLALIMVIAKIYTATN